MELHKLVLSAQSVKTMGTFAQDLFKEIKRIEKQGSRVYQTYVVDDDSGRTHFVFSTTSKDIHLSFGILGSEGQHSLSRMLKEEFMLKKCSQLLLGFEQKRDSALITQTVEQEPGTFWKTITFTFSLAH